MGSALIFHLIPYMIRLFLAIIPQEVVMAERKPSLTVAILHPLTWLQLALL